jgi:UDP-glucose 4-epimerase
VRQRALGRVTLIDGDIRDGDLVRRAMDGVAIAFDEAAIRLTQCASSASIYGQAEAFPTDEWHHGYGNRRIYGATKMYGEGLRRSFCEMYGLDYVALRYLNVYGPRMDAHAAAGYLPDPVP